MYVNSVIGETGCGEGKRTEKRNCAWVSDPWSWSLAKSACICGVGILGVPTRVLVWQKHSLLVGSLLPFGIYIRTIMLFSGEDAVAPDIPDFLKTPSLQFGPALIYWKTSRKLCLM